MLLICNLLLYAKQATKTKSSLESMLIKVRLVQSKIISVGAIEQASGSPRFYTHANLLNVSKWIF